MQGMCGFDAGLSRIAAGADRGLYVIVTGDCGRTRRPLSLNQPKSVFSPQCTITLGATWSELTVTSTSRPLLALVAICRDAVRRLASLHKVSHWWLSGATVLPLPPLLQEPPPKSRLVKKHSDVFAQPAARNAAANPDALSFTVVPFCGRIETGVSMTVVDAPSRHRVRLTCSVASQFLRPVRSEVMWMSTAVQFSMEGKQYELIATVE